MGAYLDTAAGGGGAGATGQRGLLPLIGAGLALAAVLVVGFLLPFNIRWHPGVVVGDQPMATLLGTGWAGALNAIVAILCAFAAFAVAVLLAGRVRGATARAVVLVGVVLLATTLVRTNPVGSHDVYHNAADARTFWLHGENPTVSPPSEQAGDPVAEAVWAWRDYASGYGPLWYLVAGAALPFAGDGLWANVIGQKVLAVVFLLASVALVMAIAERLRPGSGPAAGVLAGWNPLMLWATAGNAHNDIVMVTFALAAVYALCRRWWLAVFPLLALAVATKYVLVILGPPILLWLLLRRDVPRRQVALSLGLGAAVLALVSLPFLDGGFLVGAGSESERMTASVGVVFQAALLNLTALPLARAETVSKAVMVAVYGIAYLILLSRLRRNESVRRLVQISFWAVFLFLVVAKWWFWPWYLLWLIPVGALMPGSRPALVAGVFSLTAMLEYVPYQWLAYGGDWARWQLASAATLFVLPVLVALLPLPASFRPRPPHRRGVTARRSLRQRRPRAEGVAAGD